MSELLFQKDSYIKEFECKVITLDEAQNAVVLDKTAFYIGGGGQPCDSGVLKQGNQTYIVNKVKKIGSEVYHYIEGRLPEMNQDSNRRDKLGE